MACDMPAPCKFPSLDSCQKRFLWTHKEAELDPHPLVHLVITNLSIMKIKTAKDSKLLRISRLEHKTNDWVRSKISSLVGPQEPLLATVKRRKLAWFGHVTHPLQNHPSLHLGLWATP